MKPATSAAEAWDRYSKGATSEAAYRSTGQTQKNHRERVFDLWKYLERKGHTPCSHFTAARIAVEVSGEHVFSLRQTNEEVIRKRTSELVEAGRIVVTGKSTDADGREREQFAPPAITEAP